MKARAITALAAVVFCSACSDETSPATSTGSSCADACGVIFECAAASGYDLSQTVGTRGDCAALCNASTCPRKQQVTDCISRIACNALDQHSLAVLACGSVNECPLGLALPVGACDLIAPAEGHSWSGECVQYFVGTDLSYGVPYCTITLGGTWRSTCPQTDRVASCLRPYASRTWDWIEGERGVSHQFYYSGYTGNLAEHEETCVGPTYAGGGIWTTY